MRDSSEQEFSSFVLHWNSDIWNLQEKQKLGKKMDSSRNGDKITVFKAGEVKGWSYWKFEKSRVREIGILLNLLLLLGLLCMICFCRFSFNDLFWSFLTPMVHLS